ncbi:hypothetical protein D6C89_08382, partial [Aureobasidium pullulans]
FVDGSRGSLPLLRPQLVVQGFVGRRLHHPVDSSMSGVTICGTATSNTTWAFAIVYSILVIVETRLGLGLPHRLPLEVVTDRLALLALLSAYGYRLQARYWLCSPRFDEKELNDYKPAVDPASDLDHDSRSTGIAPALPAALPTSEESMVASCPRKLFRLGSAALRNIRNDNRL